MIDRALLALSDARRERIPTPEEHAFLRFCSFKYTRIPVSRGTLHAQAVLNQN